MIIRKFKATSADGGTSENATLKFSDANIQLLEQYLQNCDRLEEASIFKEPFPHVKNIKWSAESGMSFEVTDFSYGDVCELLHRARPLFLSKEPASFEKVCAVVGKAAKGTVFIRHLKHLRAVYKCGDYQPYFQITIGDVPLFDDRTLKHWLNGVEYHQDHEKAKMIQELENNLSQEIARGIFVSQLSGRVRAVFMLGHLASLIARPEANNAKQKEFGSYL